MLRALRLHPSRGTPCDMSLGTHVMPLRRMNRATSGKVPDESPLSLVDWMSFNLLQVDGDGLPVTEAGTVEAGQWTSPVRGGAMPSFEGMDGEMIKSLVKAFHRDEGTSPDFCLSRSPAPEDQHRELRDLPESSSRLLNTTDSVLKRDCRAG